MRDPDEGGRAISRLVSRARAGDAEAFGRLYDAYVDRVYGYAKARLGDAHEAEDVTETVFLKAYEAIGRYRDRGSPFGAWLFRIAHNAVVDTLRAKARRPEEPCEPDRMPEAHSEAAVDEEALQALEAAELRKRLMHLTDEQAAVLTMRYLWGLDVTEAAHALDKTEGAVKALQHRALAALRREMADEGVA